MMLTARNDVHDFSIEWTIVVWQSLVATASTSTAATTVTVVTVAIAAATIVSAIAIFAVTIVSAVDIVVRYITSVTLTLGTSSITSSIVRMTSHVMVNYWLRCSSRTLLDNNLSWVGMMLVMSFDVASCSRLAVSHWTV